MKRLHIAIITILILVVLGACEMNEVEAPETEPKEPEIKELIYVEKTNAYEEPRLVFESLEDRTYYYVTVDGWEYDNFEGISGFQEGDAIEFEIETLKTEIFGVEMDSPMSCIEVLDECRAFSRLDNYYKGMKEDGKIQSEE